MIANIYLAEGFEEAEAMCPYDCLRRAGATVNLVSICSELLVDSSHGVTMRCTHSLNNAPEADLHMLPGGMPGSLHLNECKPLHDILTAAAAQGKIVCAICAAPMVLGTIGLLKGKKATCYPGFEDKLLGAKHNGARVEHDANIITGIGAGAAMEFGLELVKALFGQDKANEVGRQMICK